MNNPEINPQLLEKANPNDFRAFMKQILEEEEEHIPNALRQLREEDPDAYLKTILGYAKFVHPQQKEVNVNIELKQKQDMYASLFEQYGYSTLVDDQPTQEVNLLPEGTMPEDYPELDPMASFISAPTQPIEDASTFDGVISPEEQDTTPPYTPQEENEDEDIEDQDEDPYTFPQQ